jgi:hypothetical protein
MPMYRPLLARLLLASLFALAACGGSETTSNNGAPDVAIDAGADTSVADASDAGADAADATDAGSDASEDDASSHDASDAPDVPDASDTTGDSGSDADAGNLPLAGFGDISGECGVLDDELTTADSYYIVNSIDFGADPYDDGDASLLTEGGREIIADGNAGGSSVLSEVFAYEVLERCELAMLLKTETEVVYTASDSKLTDILVEIDTLKIGVSVTRAVGWPREDPYTVEQAKSLLEDKLLDIQDSSANVAAEDAWTKQILHVIAYEDQHAASLETAYGQLDASVTADSVVFVTVSDGDDGFLY